MKFENTVVLVTGGSGGIGRAVCVRFAAEGASVIIHYGHNRAAAEETERLCKEAARKAAAAAGRHAQSIDSGSEDTQNHSTDSESTSAQNHSIDSGSVSAEPSYGETLLIGADISKEEECDALFKEALAWKGKLDVLVNNAGITRDNLLLMMSSEDFDAVINTNLRGTFLCMKKAARAMLRKRYGRIINVSSIVGVEGNAGQANYAAAKAGVIAMTKSVSKELAARNITVNAVAPGMIETEMTASLPEEVKSAMLSAIPCGRAGKAEEVAQAIVFLAEKESAYITGQVLGIDGGM
ncbi:MAG: beta-ketoacyl-ACP reductase [Eubacterium sp.]|nr:beta-ketoacyl-ACP reductase [Eubacterium sp.]